jgi:glycosyltransferase involved in cell wall biosynthesis
MFAEADVDLLRRHHDVRILNTVISRHRPVASAAAICRIAMLAAWADLIYVWFADLHAYVAVRIGRALGRPSMVVLGGYEVASVPDLGYGLLADDKMAPCVRYVLDHADRILAVDEGLLLDAERFLNRRPPSWRVLPTGYDPTRYRPSGEKQDFVLTVFWGDNIGRARVKGLDTFLSVAALLPDIRFGVIGACGEVDAWLRRKRSPNVEVIPPIPQDELIAHYQGAKVYAQFSLREGLPNAVCEAMLCGCVPVGTPVQGITTAMGPLGHYAPLGDPGAGAEAIARALESPDGLAARERIATLFPLVRREDGLLALVDEITGE